jgi:hypothetical protein
MNGDVTQLSATAQVSCLCSYNYSARDWRFQTKRDCSSLLVDPRQREQRSTAAGAPNGDARVKLGLRCA